MIRIIRGKNKKTKIDVPKIGVRPTSSIKKESIFSILESYSLKNNYEIYKKKYFYIKMKLYSILFYIILFATF